MIKYKYIKTLNMANYLNTYSLIDSSWKTAEIDSKFQQIVGDLKIEHDKFDGMVEIYPPTDKVFNAFTQFKLFVKNYKIHHSE